MLLTVFFREKLSFWGVSPFCDDMISLSLSARVLLADVHDFVIASLCFVPALCFVICRRASLLLQMFDFPFQVKLVYYAAHDTNLLYLAELLDLKWVSEQK